MFSHLTFTTIYVEGIATPTNIHPLAEEKTQVLRGQWPVKRRSVSG